MSEKIRFSLACLSGSDIDACLIHLAEIERFSRPRRKNVHTGVCVCVLVYPFVLAIGKSSHCSALLF